MDLGNLIEIVAHYHLIRWTICLDHWDEFPMESAQVCMFTTLNRTYDESLRKTIDCHDLPNYYIT